MRDYILLKFLSIGVSSRLVISRVSNITANLDSGTDPDNYK